jgi:hypothetical protein
MATVDDRAVGGGGPMVGVKLGATVLWAVALVVGAAFAAVVVEAGLVYDEVVVLGAVVEVVAVLGAVVLVVFGAAAVEVAVRKFVVDANADTVGEEVKVR